MILRVSREHHRTLWAALTLLRKVGGVECVARVVHVSGALSFSFSLPKHAGA